MSSLAAALLCATLAAGGGDPEGQFAFRAFGTEQGLQNLVVWQVDQDRTGFIWAGTDEGVYRYDGQRFDRFSVSEGLPSGSTTALALAPDGSLCAGTVKGLACWNGTGFGTAWNAGLPTQAIDAMASGPDGKLWVATGGGLYVRSESQVFTAVPGWPGGSARSLWIDALGLAAGRGSNVWLRSPAGSWSELGAEAGLGQERIDGLVRDPAGTLWIRSPRRLWILEPGASRVRELTDGLPPSFDSGHLAIGPSGRVWVATDRGIAFRKGEGWELVGLERGLTSFGARTIFEDREGTVWGGGVGLYEWLGRGLVQRFNESTGFPGNIAWSIRRDAKGTLWAGTNQCLARVVDGRWACLPGTEGHTVRSFVFTPEGGILFGGAPPELLYVDPSGQVSIYAKESQLPDQHLLSLVLDAHGELWIGTKLGLYRVQRRDGPRVLERITLPGASPTARVSSLISDGQGRLWAAGEAGLAVLQDGAWRMLGERDGFRASSFRYVSARRDGSVCASYTEALGLSCFRFEAGRVSALRHYDVASGLATGMVYLFGEDPQGRLWVGTGNGVDVFTEQGVDHFSERIGLAGDDSAALAFYAEADGSLWIGANGGLSRIASDRYRVPPPPPNALILGMRLGGAEALPRAPGPLRVDHDHGSLEVRYGAMSFVATEQLSAQVRLLPLEPEWRASNLLEAHYLALPPGEYTFEVRMRTGAGAWGEPGRVQFSVLPAWWQRRGFHVAAVLFGLGAFALLATWRSRVLLARKTQQLIARSDASFRAVLDALPDLVIVHRQGRAVYMNGAARSTFGYEGLSWQGVELLNLVQPEDRASARRYVEGVGSPSGDSPVQELRFIGRDGATLCIEVVGLTTELGGEPAVVTVGRDVTERKRLQAKLLVSDRMASLGTLAAGIAHEINNPLAYVKANLDMVSEVLKERPEATARPEDRTELIEALADARDGAERVRKIVAGLRSFSRSQEEQRGPVELSAVLDQAIKLTANEVRHRAHLVREFGPAPTILGDEARLTQVFINLIVNATHAIPEGRSDSSRITLRIRTDAQGNAVAEVEDTGRGMSTQVLQRVFDPFFTTKGVGEGTGLGLSICHGIVSSHGGLITLESTPGVGTTARVVLPPGPGAVLKPEKDAATTPSEAAPKRRILIVDDEPLVGNALQRALSRDHHVVVVGGAQEALARIRTGERFDAIVSDVMMPTMTGIELLDELERVAPEQATRLVMITGGAFTPQTRERLEKLRVPRLEKPVPLDELRRIIAELGEFQAAARRSAAG